MSRDIDMSDVAALSDADVAYVRQRGVPWMIAELNKLPADKPMMEPVDEPYDKWTNDELREELKNRELDTKGDKKDLVARLEQYDAEHPDD